MSHSTKRRSGDAAGRSLTFGTTGNLVNSNLLMYDRVTDSDWPQLLGVAISGPAKDARLEEIPLVWTTWGRWRATRPDTVVLSTKTGYARTYGDDPYGSYTPVGGYYASGGPIFPVLAESDRLPAKEVVVGVNARDAHLAIRRRPISEAKALSFEAGRVPLLAVWDDELETARVFRRTVRGRRLRFATGELRDSTGSRWTTRGRATAGPLRGAQLEQADFLDVMWFAWHAFFPRTELVG